ncbi:MAG: slipin family protein, partial [Candidatus Omnitrophica bacterium]|nr:slipin family protein [Candidatus Omnitrophota bacterium]
TMKRAMASQAESERNRRAKIINAEGEFQASEKLVAASKILEQSPLGIQLRYLQVATEIASEKNSTLVFPLPLELFGAWLKKQGKE